MEICKSELCSGCTACAAVCPKKCIEFVSDEEGFLRPSVNEESCIKCGRCIKVCPINKEKLITNNETEAYAMVNCDDEIRFESTSGGVFTSLCQWIFERGGVVFGAAYDENFKVVHIEADNLEKISKLRGAKYSQSDLQDTFIKVKERLCEDKFVLFSGTPCQVWGLHSFLGKEYEKLILVDLICHGVPSPEVFKKYIEHRSAKDAEGNKPTNINLRSKVTGWPTYSIKFDYEKECYSVKNGGDPFLRGFIGNVFLRQSCYQCKFKGVNRISDFTLGDYWGVWNQQPDFHDFKGTSLVLVHSKKAKDCLSSLSSQIRYKKVDALTSLKDNPSALVSFEEPKIRKEFFDSYKTEDFNDLLNRIYPKPVPKKPSFSQKAISFIKRGVKKVLYIIKK